jgi:hypothetical protein
MRNADRNNSAKTIRTITTPLVIVALITMIIIVASNNSGGQFLTSSISLLILPQIVIHQTIQRFLFF